MGILRSFGNVLTAGMIDRNDAKNTIKAADFELEDAKETLEKVRKDTETSLSNYGSLKLKVAAGSLTEFEGLFSQLERLEQIELTQHDNKLEGLRSSGNIAQIRQVSVAAGEALGAVGAGAAGGAVAYAGAIGLAGWIGTASTGTAIGTLSGAAATNATLAWLGGGALSAGGAGMVGGAVVLGGIALAPFVLILGGIGASKAKQQLNEAENYYDRVMVEVSKMKTLETELGQIRRGSELLSNLIVSLSALLEYLNSGINLIIQNKSHRDEIFRKHEQLYQEQLAKRELKNSLIRFFANIFKPIKNENKEAYFDYMPEEETHIINSFNVADLLVKILNTPLMNEDGSFLSGPISKLKKGGAKNIIKSESEDAKIEAVEKLRGNYLPEHQND